MVIAVNEGAKLNTVYQMVSLSYYVPQKDRSYAPKGFSSASAAVSFFSQTIAPYPYEKLALIIGATRFGGMENSSAIVFTSTLFDSRPEETMRNPYLRIAERRWPEAAWVAGHGPYATLSCENPLTVLLHETEESARATENPTRRNRWHR